MQIPRRNRLSYVAGINFARPRLFIASVYFVCLPFKPFVLVSPLKLGENANPKFWITILSFFLSFVCRVKPPALLCTWSNQSNIFTAVWCFVNANIHFIAVPLHSQREIAPFGPHNALCQMLSVTRSHSCHKRSVSCLPSDCISVSMHSALLIVCNHGFVSGALTHTSLHATSALPPPNLLPSPAPLSCARLSPKGIAVTVKRPTSPCLTTRVFVRGNANVSPLILSCHLMVTPAGAPIKGQAFRWPRRNEPFLQTCPLRTLSILVLLVIYALLCAAQSHFRLYSSPAALCWRDLKEERAGGVTTFSLKNLMRLYSSALRWYLGIISGVMSWVEMNGIKLSS